MITQERQNKTSGTFGFTNTGGNVHRHQYEASSVTASSTNPINIYLVYLNDNVNRLTSSSNWGEITFEHEIIGIYNRNYDTIAMSGVSIDGATYPDSNAQKFNRRGFEDNETNGGQDDWVVSNGNKTLTLKSDNGEKGDFIRVFTYASKPVANSDTGYINEGSTLSVSNAASAVSGTSSGSHSGDVEANDTDLIGGSGSNIHTLTATSYEHTSGTTTSGGSLSSNGNSGTAGSNSVAGLYGTLDLEANGSYTYAASDNISGLDSGETVTDVFTYTITDGLSTDTATITITIIGQSSNNAPVAAANTATVNEDDTVTVTGNSATSITYEVNDEVDSATNVKTDTSEGEGSGVSFSSDGGKMFITGNGTNRIHEFTLSTPFDPTTKSYVDSVLLDWNNSDDSSDVDYSDDQGDWVRGHTWKSDGTKLFIMNWDGGLSGDASASYRILSYDLTTPYDVSTISRSNAYVNTPTSSDSYDTGLGSVRDIQISSDGTKFYTINKATGKLMQYTFATAYDLNSSVTVGGPYTLTNVTTPRSIAFSDNGKKLFVGDDATTEIIHQFNLTTAWDASTIVWEGSITPDQTAGGDTTDDPFGIAFSNDGTKMFIQDINGNDEIKVHSLKSPFNLIDIDGENDGDVLADDTDADSGDTLTVTQIAVTGQSNSSVASSSSYNSSGTSKTGTYGTLRIGADGTYDYVADQSAADALDPGDIVTDSFTYTVSDGTDTDTETLIVTVIGINDAPVGVNDTDAVNEDATITESSGSELLVADDTDADDSSSLTVTQIAVTGGSNSSVAISSTYNSNGTSITGTYGTLVVGANGSYTYTADQSATDALDASDTVTDSFTYTVSDGTATSTATLIITVTGINDDPVAVNDTDAVNEDATITESSGSELLVADDTDADDSSSLTVTQIAVTGGSNSSVAGSSTYNSNFTSVTGTYGTLKVGADGSYSYVADQDAADALDASDTVTDSFTYTVSDGTATDTATLIITVTGINDAPVADNETGAVNEDATLTVSDGTSDVLYGDTDADDSASLTVTTYSHTSATKASGASASSANGSSGTAGSDAVVGYYGTLTLAADGTYTYAADQSRTDALNASDQVTDVFTYTVSDGTATDTATITITITGVNDAPVAQNDTGTINEDATLTVSNSINATSVTGVSQDTGSPYSLSAGTARSVAFNDDGTKMFVVHAPGSATISEHALTTAFDINTASQSTTYDISSHISEPRGIRFNNDGTKLYIISSANSNKKIHEFSLSTAYDVSSLPTPSSTVISSQDGGPRGFTFNTDGTKMFLLGDTNHHVYEYSLSTAFDTTTISYTSRSLDFSSREVTPRGISFNPTGSKLFITGQSSDEILEYDLSTGFNLSTATFNGAFDVNLFANKPNDIVFNNDGSKAFIARASSNAVLSFHLQVHTVLLIYQVNTLEMCLIQVLHRIQIVMLTVVHL